jgi:phosphate starvation-inducible protein PhoH and related proteins
MADPTISVTIALESHDEELAVLGSRDQYLRQIRDTLGIKILARHGELRLDGEQDRVERAQTVFDELRKLFSSKSPITSNEVSRILESTNPAAAKLAQVSPSPSALDLREGAKLVRARTEGQAEYLKTLKENELVFVLGPAGTGKTYLAVAVAVAALRTGSIKKIVLVRPAVEAGEHLGFLPGDLEAKINPYLRPLLDALHDLMEFDQIRRYMSNDLIEIAPLAYMRGRTLNDSMIILDEGQNATIPQMKMFLTRMGTNARIVVTGDPTQNDLPPGTPSGINDAVARIGGIKGVGVVRMTQADIVRHPLVQAIVNAYEKPLEGSD